MNDLFSKSDTLTLILQHCESIQTLAKIAQLNRSINTHIMHNASGIWLDLASRLTGHNAKEHITTNDDDFHSKLKLLVCPWLSIPRALSLPIDPLLDPDDMSITLVNNDSVALWNDSKVVEVANARQAIRPWRFTGSASDLHPPSTPSRKIFQPIVSPPQLQLANQHDCRYFFQHIHKSAMAIVEITPWDMEHRSGIYFFRNSHGRATKLLRHILVGINPAETSMIIKPMEMWMLTEERVLYFGPDCNMLPLTIAGRMDRALWMAGVGKVKTAMRFLQRIGVADINTPCITGNMTLLHIATMQNQIKAVQSLLKEKADPEARDDQQMSCVMIASSLEYPDMIRVLCDEGKANPNAITHCNETALHIVGHQCNTDQLYTKHTVRALLDSLADPNAEDVKGQTPLFSVAILDTPCAAKLLCSRGADPMHRNNMGRTPLHALFEVCLKADTAVILVKKFNADVNVQDRDGTTPLMLAARTRAFVNVRSLLHDLNADPSIRNRKGHDALWFAKNGTDAPAQARAVVRMIEDRCRMWGKDDQVV